MQEQSIMLLPGEITGKISFWIVVIKRNTLNLWQDTRKDSEILAYVLMDNHLHILIRIDQTPLSKVMQGIQQCYTQYFNQKYKHIGHVFQQRYKAFLCDNDSYLTALVVYIHQNPIRAKLPEGTDYLWSSHKDYTAGNSVLVDIDFILNMLHPNRREAYRKYFRPV